MSQIPPDLQQFILDRVPSVPWLEAGLLLRTRSPAALTPAVVAAALYVGERQAASLLEDLVRAGWAAREGDAWRFAPGDETLRDLIDRLATAYATHLVAVTMLIHDATRRDAHRFAGAFRFRKE